MARVLRIHRFEHAYLPQPNIGGVGLRNLPACDREGKIHDGNDRGLRFRHVSGVEELLRNRAGKGTSQLGELELRFGERQPGSCLRHPALGYPNLFFTQLVFQ